MSYDCIDLKNFFQVFSYKEEKGKSYITEGNSFLVGAILVLFLILIPLHIFLAYVELEVVHQVFGLLEAINILVILAYRRIVIVIDNEKKQLTINKKCCLLHKTKKVDLKEVDEFKVKSIIWGLTKKYTDRLSVFYFQAKIKGAYQNLLSSLTISNGGPLWVIADICQQNLRKGKFVPVCVERELPFRTKKSMTYYALNFISYWLAAFVFMFGAGLLAYLKRQDWEVMQLLFSPEIMLGYTAILLVISFYFGFLVKEK